MGLLPQGPPQGPPPQGPLPRPALDAPGAPARAWSAARAAIAGRGAGLPEVFWWLWLGELLSALATFVFPFLTLFLAARGFSPARIGLLAACLGGGRLAFAPLAGELADRVGRRPVLLAALVATAACALLLASLEAPLPIAAAVFAFGAASTAMRAPIQAIVADVVPAAETGRAMGLLYWARNLGIGLSSLAGGFLAARGWALPFALDAATTLAFAAVVLRRLPETRPPARGAHRSAGGAAPGWGEVLRDRAFVGLLALTVLFVLVFWQHQTALPLEMTRRGLPPMAFGAALAVNTALVVAVQPFAARLTRRFSVGAIMCAAALLVGAGFAGHAWCETLPQYAAAAALWSLGEIGYLPQAAALVARLAPARLRGRYAGAYGLAQAAGMVAAPVAGTALLQGAGGTALWLACLALAAVAGAGALALGRAAGGRGHAG